MARIYVTAGSWVAPYKRGWYYHFTGYPVEEHPQLYEIEGAMCMTASPPNFVLVKAALCRPGIKLREITTLPTLTPSQTSIPPPFLLHNPSHSTKHKGVPNTFLILYLFLLSSTYV